jgi:arylsulfatase A-like enzyme
MYWKTPKAYAVREGDWKLLEHRNGQGDELFDLKNDFRESRNRIERNPDKAEHLKQLMEQMKEGDRE